jgi:hypothetical protein
MNSAASVGEPLSEVCALCGSWQAGDQTQFARIVQVCLEHGIVSLDQFRDDLSIPQAIVKRWAGGMSQPHVLMQQRAVEYIRAKVLSLG